MSRLRGDTQAVLESMGYDLRVDIIRDLLDYSDGDSLDKICI